MQQTVSGPAREADCAAPAREFNLVHASFRLAPIWCLLDGKGERDMGERYWFRPKSFGYGATPITWEGWAVTLGSMAVTMAAVLVAISAEIRQWPDRRALQAICLIVLFVTLLVTVIIARRRTNREW